MTQHGWYDGCFWQQWGITQPFLGDTMTLKNLMLVISAATTFTSAVAGAYIVPGDSRPPIPPPIRDDFGNGGIGYGNGRIDNGNGRFGRQEQKIIYLNRRVFNESLALRQLAGIGQNYRGYLVESVVVNVRRSEMRSQLALVADGRIQAAINSPQGPVQLRTQYRAVLDQDISTLRLNVNGNIDIDSITINLRDEGRVDRPDRPGRDIELPLQVSRRLYGNDRLDLTQYIDVQRYRGMRIVAVDIEATAVYNTALIDLVINGFNQGQTLQIDRYSNVQSVYLNNAILGQGADSIVLYTRGDVDVRRVTLRLSRR